MRLLVEIRAARWTARLPQLTNKSVRTEMHRKLAVRGALFTAGNETQWLASDTPEHVRRLKP